jgi:transglutaminase-like putative cysteine protease
VTRYRVRHRTTYEYEGPVLHAHHLARLRPRNCEGQRVEATEVNVAPTPAAQRRTTDYFGNDGDRIEVAVEHDLLDVTATSTVVVLQRPLSEAPPRESPSWERTVEILQRDPALLAVREMTFDSPLVRAHGSLARYAQPAFGKGRPLVDALLELNHRVHTEFSYDPTATDVSTPLAQVLRERRGVCQDFAHIVVGCLRSLGLAARYVSGYLETLPPEGQSKLIGADASHAWASVYVPGSGWLDLDPTNDVIPGTRHIVLAWGRDFSDVSPLVGVVLGGGAHRLSVGVDVESSRD